MIQSPEMLNVVLLGAGMAGENLAREVKHIPGVKLVGVYDPNTPLAAQVAQQHHAMHHTNLNMLIDQVSPDIAVIASANHAHAENVCQCIEAGIRNVFCEKPLALEMADASRMTELAELHDVKTSMGFAGIHVGYACVLDMIANGELGDILSMYLHTYRGYGFWGQERVNVRGRIAHHAAVTHPQNSGGWTIHHACHPVFVMMQIAGNVQSVFGSIRSSHPDCPSEEMIHATLSFTNGTVGTLIDSIGSFRGIRFGVIGTRATVVMDDDYTKHADDRIQLRLRREGQNVDQVQTLSYDAYAISRLAQFVQSIRHNEPSPITFRQGMENLRICQAIRRSGMTGQLVELSPFENAPKRQWAYT
jgi:predicted dehydrogenase